MRKVIDEGIRLRAAQVIPATLYTKEDLATFREADEGLRDLLPRLVTGRRAPRKR